MIENYKDMNACLYFRRVLEIPQYGDTEGICRITNEKSVGVKFSKWVRKTFNDHDSLYPGDIISNEALFCFDEASTIIQERTGRDKPQRFRTYSHIITNDDEWHILTKADKKKIYDLITSGNTKIVSLTDTGQKHIFFKNKPGMWQLDEQNIKPDLIKFKALHETMQELLLLGFSQTQIRSGNYNQSLILRVGIENWENLEKRLKKSRGEPIFDLAAWLMFNDQTE